MSRYVKVFYFLLVLQIFGSSLSTSENDVENDPLTRLLVVSEYQIRDPCSPSPCKNNATCTISDQEKRAFICKCTEKFEGGFCEIKKDICDPNPCQHGSTCRVNPNDENDYACENCPRSYQGKNCDIEFSSDESQTWSIAAPDEHLAMDFSIQARRRFTWTEFFDKFRAEKDCQWIKTTICRKPNNKFLKLRFVCKVCELHNTKLSMYG